MDGYKKIIRSKELRSKILDGLEWIPDKQMLEIQYFIKMHRPLHLKNPKRWTEKIQWYKLYYHDPLMTQCADKYRVREYIEKKGYSDLLNELYYVFEKPEEITEDVVERLPEQFVIKTNGSCGTNIIVKDKAAFRLDEARQKLSKWLAKSKHKYPGREWPYYDIEPKIIIEKFLDGGPHGLTDYKFFCFNGEPTHLLVISDRFTDEKIDLYSAKWKRLNVIQSDCPHQTDHLLPKPRNFERMLEVAKNLSKDFPQVRVDLYDLDGKIYFGELTFFSGSGYYIFTPDSFDYYLGKKFVLPEPKMGGGYSMVR